MRHRPCLKADPVRDKKSLSVIYTMGGKLIGKPECFEFLEDVRDAIEDGYVNVILKMGQVERINSTGVGILAAIFTAVNERDGRVYVVDAPKNVSHFLEVSNLWSFLTECESVTLALSKTAVG